MRRHERAEAGSIRPMLAVALVLAVAVACAVWIIESTPSDRGSATQQTRSDDRRPLLVHLGDSYASGAGTSPLVEDSPFPCQRSQRNFGELLGQRRNLHVIDASCAGATTEQLYASQYDGVPPQLDALDPGAAYVTVLIGGNDSALYMTMVGECTRLAAADPTGEPCRAAFGRRPFQEIAEKTARDVEAGLRAIGRKAPAAQIVAVGYPWLLPATTSCRPAVGIADGDVPYVHRIQAALNTAVEKAARAAGATYVDMEARSVGHEACSKPGLRWIEPQIGADSPIVMHPNAMGQRAIADAVAQALR